MWISRAEEHCNLDIENMVKVYSIQWDAAHESIILESLWLLAGSPRCFWSFKGLWLNRILPRETSALSFKSHHSPSCQIQLALLNNAFPFKTPISLLRKQMTQMFYIRVKRKEFLEQSSPNRALLHRIVIPENRFFGQMHLRNSG